jgi:putative ABC transport system ATP-binding protein
MLRLENINVILGKQSKLECHVLKNLSLEVAAGEFVVIIGGNGAGKSTLLNVISGEVKADTGTIVLDNATITAMPQTNRAAIIAKVMQDPRIGSVANMSIMENMAFALEHGKARNLFPFVTSARKQLFKEKLSLLGMGLENKLDELVANLSGGQRQALSLIMASLADAKILLLDEITAALDPKTANNVMKIADKIVAEEGRTCIMITHNMAQAIEYGDRTLLLSNGEVVKEFSSVTKSLLTPALLAAEFGEI